MEELLPTIVPNENFNAEKAAQRLRTSMRGMGTDERSVIQVLTNHNSIQRAEISNMYKKMYGSDLIEDLKSELGGHFEKTVVALLIPPYELLIDTLHDCLGLVDTDAQGLTEILCCRTPSEIEHLKAYYAKKHKKSLEDDLSSRLSGDFRSLMIGLVTTGGSESEAVNVEKARADAQALYDAGIGKNLGTHEEEFTRILNSRSFSQLAQIFQEYEKLSSEPLAESIKSECSGDYRHGLLAIVKRIEDAHGFFAERLHDSLQGVGTDDKTLIRILVSRSEENLGNVKQRYFEMYGKSLVEDVQADTAGDYAKILTRIIG